MVNLFYKVLLCLKTTGQVANSVHHNQTSFSAVCFQCRSIWGRGVTLLFFSLACGSSSICLGLLLFHWVPLVGYVL